MLPVFEQVSPKQNNTFPSLRSCTMHVDNINSLPANLENMVSSE